MGGNEIQSYFLMCVVFFLFVCFLPLAYKLLEGKALSLLFIQVAKLNIA